MQLHLHEGASLEASSSGCSTYDSRRSPAAPGDIIVVSLKQSAVRGAIVTLIGQWAKFAIQICSIIVLSRVLPSTDFGLVSMATAITNIANLLGDFGLSTASVQAQDATHRETSNLFWLNVVLGCVFSAAVYAVAPLIALFYHQVDLVRVVHWISIVFFLNAAAAQFRAECQRRLRFRPLALCDVVSMAVGTGVAIILAVQDAGYMALVAQPIVATATLLVMLIAVARWLPLPPTYTTVRRFIRFGANNLGVQLINYTSGNIDTILVGKFWGSVDAGLYSRAFQLLMLPIQQIVGPMTRVALPVLSRLESQTEFRRYFLRSQLALGYITVGVLSLAAVFCFPAFQILLGPSWQGVKVLFLVLIAGGVFELFAYPFSWIYLSRAATGRLLKVTLWTRPIMIILIGIGAIWGPLGVSIAVSVGFFFNWLAQLLIELPFYGFTRRELLLVALRPLMFFGLMTLVASPLAWLNGTWANPWLQVIALSGVVGAYITVAVATSRALREDLAGIKSAVFAGRLQSRLPKYAPVSGQSGP
jgi:O-antigen/teichoic acid export membrane protein